MPTRRHRRRAPLVLSVSAATVLVTTAACGQSSTPLSGRQASVQATATPVKFTNCAQQCTGDIDGAAYDIKLPSRWNGTLLLYSHGYRFASPAPPSFEPPDTKAQVSSTDDDGTGNDALSQQLLSDGYALAGSSYKSNGWAVADGVRAGEQLHDRFVSLVGKPKRTYVWGDSLGGLITEVIAERHPEWVDGAAPMCGAVAGPNLNFDVALDVAFAVKTLVDPSLKITGFASADDAAANWKQAQAAVTKAAGDVAGGGTAKILLIAGLVDAPTKTRTYDGADLASQVKARVEALLTALAFGTSGRYEIERRVGGNPSDNTKTDYATRLNEAESALIQTAGGKPAALLAQLQAAPRVSADAPARTAFTALGDTTGELKVPTVTMHTEYDPLVLVQNEQVLQSRVLSKGQTARLAQLYIKPPSSYDETSGAPYGAGHCIFSDGQREALVTTLDAWVRQGVYLVPAGVAGRFGGGLDASYTAGPWPGSSSTQ